MVGTKFARRCPLQQTIGHDPRLRVCLITAMPPVATRRIEKKGIKRRRRERPEVQVVACPSAFPISNKPQRQTPPTKESPSPTKSIKKELDWNETAREVRALGATAFVGKQKRNYEDEQYRLLTGRERKKQRVPLPIVRGIKKKAAAREARAQQEAKEAGIVLPKQPKQTVSKRDRTADIHGPAPSIGFVSKGMLKVKGTPR